MAHCKFCDEWYTITERHEHMREHRLKGELPSRRRKKVPIAKLLLQQSGGHDGPANNQPGQRAGTPAQADAHPMHD